VRRVAQERHAWLSIVALAWPVVLSTLSYSLMTIVDTWFAGRLGPEAISGVSLGGTAAFSSICFGVGFLRAVKVLSAHARGQEHTEKAARVVGAGIAAALFLSVLCGAIGLGFASYLSSSTHGSESNAIARHYLLLRLCGTPVALLSCALREARYGARDTQRPMLAALVANLAHIPLNYGCMFTLGLGVPGAACATLVTQTLELAVLFDAQRKDGFGLRRTTPREVRELLAVGGPIGAEFLLGVGAFSALVLLIARMGPTELAAHQIALQITHVTFMPTVAVGEAASVLVADAVGADRDSKVQELAAASLRICCAYAGACSLAFICFSTPLIATFTSDPPTIVAGVRLLRVAALFQIIDAINIVTRSVLRGAGDVRVPAVIATTAGWVLVPPLTVLLGIHMGYGALGGWVALTAETTTIALLLSLRLRSGSWRVAAASSRLRLSESR
jgi:multidrug resistance protein, MATE family